MGEAAKPLIFEDSKKVVMSCCVAGVALRDIHMCLQTCRNSFCVIGAILWQGFQTMTFIFRGRRSTLETIRVRILFYSTCLLRLPRKSEARSYEVLRLLRKIILANLKI